MPTLTQREALNLELRVQLVRSRRTAADAARVLKLSQTQVGARLSGRLAWRIDELWVVADMCGISLPTLLIAAESAVEQVSA